MKISIDKNVVEFVPATPAETQDLETCGESLRIPLISATHSTRSRPLIPRDPGHRFQRISAS